MAELVRHQLYNNTDYSNSDIIRTYTYRGKTEGSLRIGNETTTTANYPSTYTNQLVRIHFKTDEYGASSLKWGLNDQVYYYPAGHNDNNNKLSWTNGICYYGNSSSKVQLTGKVKYAVTKDPEALIRTDWTFQSFSQETAIDSALDESGYIIKHQVADMSQSGTSTEYMHLNGECDVNLEPETDYYIWLYLIENVASYMRLFLVTGWSHPPLLTVETEGSARCTLTYDESYDGGYIDSEQYSIGDIVTIRGTEEGRAGHSFYEWNTSVTGNGTGYKPGDDFIIRHDTTLYAIWSADYTVSYNGNGSTSGSVASTRHTAKVASALASNTYQRRYTISLNGNGGTASQSTMSVSHTPNGWTYNNQHYNDRAIVSNLTQVPGATVTMLADWTLNNITLPSATRPGYRLMSWNTAADGSGIAYQKNKTFAPTSNMTLYAQWIADGSHNLSIFIKVDGQWKTSTAG